MGSGEQFDSRECCVPHAAVQFQVLKVPLKYLMALMSDYDLQCMYSCSDPNPVFRVKLRVSIYKLLYC